MFHGLYDISRLGACMMPAESYVKKNTVAVYDDEFAYPAYDDCAMYNEFLYSNFGCDPRLHGRRKRFPRV